MTDKSKRVETFINNPKKAVWTLTLPMLLGMIVQYLYSLTDTFFVSKISTDAIAAMQFNLPFVFFAISICFGLGIGITAIISQALGAKDTHRANNTAEHAVLLGVVLGVFISAVSIIFRYPIFKLLGAPENIIGLAVQYFEIIVFGFIFNILGVFFRSILSGEGDAKTPVRFMIIGTVINIGLDPLFIFVFKLGIAGAAWATITAQFVVTVLYIIFFFVKKDSLVQFKFSDFSFSWEIIGKTIKIGLPASLSMVIMSFGQMIYNRIVVYFGSDVVASVGIGMRLDQLFFLPIMGLSGSLVTLIGMFFGAKRMDLVRSTWLYTIKWGEILAVTFGLLFYFISPYFMKMFASDPAIIETGVTYIRYVVFAYPFIVVGMISGRVFQGLGNGMPGLILTTLRIAVIIIPLALLFTRVFDWGVQGVFLSQVISSFIASLIAYFWLSGYLKKIEKKEITLEV
ncbi:MAG: MATE family efflux transporter [Candidatus Marinimicrobia bacterium]|nr:MATE family efflux transporter [Candidatus Neomarinimicrobiota bacterium]